jgi:ABC-type bacteriocin/lantibiotic exporter with double-glycine peptidase domain
MNRYLSIINTRTALALGISFLISYVTLARQFQYNFDLALISIAIIFPSYLPFAVLFEDGKKRWNFYRFLKPDLLPLIVVSRKLKN